MTGVVKRTARRGGMASRIAEFCLLFEATYLPVPGLALGAVYGEAGLARRWGRRAGPWPGPEMGRGSWSCRLRW